MKWKFLNVPLGVNAPSGTLAKCADVAAAANIAGNFLNFIGQMDANNINATQSERWRNTTIEQNQKNRDWQSSENRAAEAWQEKMWRLQNEYNTPLAQRQRLQEAGYNPWISGSGGPQSLAGSAGQGHSASASQLSLPAPIPAQNALSGFSTLGNAFALDANIANQNAKTMMELLQVYDKARESGMSHDDAVSMISPMLKAIGGLSKEMNYTLEGRKVDFESKQLANDYQSLKNDIYSKYGAKEAEAKIANIEQLTTKYVGELGLMSSQADLNRSEIELNNKRAYELGAKAASEFAQAGLFSSESAINNGVYKFVLGNAFLDYNTRKMGYIENKADFDSRSKIRDWLRTGSAKTSKLATFNSSPDNNPFFAFMKGFSDSAPVKIGLNYNFGKSQTYGNSWIYNAKDFYPTP